MDMIQGSALRCLSLSLMSFVEAHNPGESRALTYDDYNNSLGWRCQVSGSSNTG